MSVELLTENHLEFQSLKEGCTGLSQKATLLKITCHGSNALLESAEVEKVHDQRF